MEPIFDRQGRTAAWRNRDVVHDLGGRPAAFIRDRAVFSLGGVCLGRFEDGLFRDAQGAVIAFLRDAGSPMPLPVPEEAPVPPVPGHRPPEPRFGPVTARAWRALRWSDQPWDSFLGARHTAAH